jgi:hypothetical protein
MLILDSASDTLSLNTASGGSVDVHASWMDNVAGAVGPGRANTPTITTATTVVIVPAPGAGAQRNVKTLHIRNKAAASNAITIYHSDGVTSVLLHTVTLLPGTTLQYIDEVGFLVPIHGIQ